MSDADCTPGREPRSIAASLGFSLLFRLHRSTTYVDVAYCYRPSSVVCRSVMMVSSAKMAEPIEMLFGLWTQVGPRKHVFDGGADPHGKGQF